MIDGLIAANAPGDVIARVMARSDRESEASCEVWAENWQVLELFIALSTQWTISAMGQCTGLHYPSVESTMNMLCIPCESRAELFADVRIMERAALEFINQKTK